MHFVMPGPLDWSIISFGNNGLLVAQDKKGQVCYAEIGPWPEISGPCALCTQASIVNYNCTNVKLFLDCREPSCGPVQLQLSLSNGEDLTNLR